MPHTNRSNPAGMLRRMLFAGLAITLALLCGACAGMQAGPTQVSAINPYNACLQQCAGMGDQSAFVRDGCRRGCELVLEDFSLRGAHYATLKGCTEAVQRLDMAAELAALTRRCQKTWDSTDRRLGCKQAGEAFYNAVDANVCVSGMP